MKSSPLTNVTAIGDGVYRIRTKPETEVTQVEAWQWKCNLCNTVGLEYEAVEAVSELRSHMEFHA